jgi:pyrroline-5-carboxylate reductase
MTTIGFIGTGAITQAVVTGLCTLEAPPARIWVSPRNAARAKALTETFPRVSVAADNQSLLEACETVCLAVRPDVAEALLEALHFRETQRVVSFVAMLSMERLRDLAAPATRICRMVPLPAVAEHLGPIALCPPDDSAAALFEGIGTLVQVEDEARLHALWATTAMMAPFFGSLKLMSAWLEERHIAPEQARRYVASMTHALSVTGMAAEEEDFERLIVDHATPRGLNEQALRELEDAGWYATLSEVLSLIEKRLNGRADIDSRIGGPTGGS